MDDNFSLCRVNSGKVLALGPSARGKAVVRSRSNRTLRFEDGDVITGDLFWRSRGIHTCEVCHISVLHRSIIARAFEEFPEDRERFLAALESQTAERRPLQVSKILRERSIFAKTSQEFIDEIVKYGSIRVFMPGDRIIEQGTHGTTMFILWVGTANVVLEGMDFLDGESCRTLTNVGALTHGSVFGELVTLGVQSKRTASIVVSSVCCTWEVPHQVVLSILDRHPIERTNFMQLVEEHLGKQAAKSIIHHQLFASFHQQFRTLIGVHCDRRLFFPGETILREGSLGDRMYIVNLGTATVQLHNQNIMQVKGGSHFGFPNICTVSDRDREPYPVTVVAETMCQVLCITRSHYQHALQKYPDMREVARRIEEDERHRSRKQRDGFIKLVQRRRKLRRIVEALRGGASGGLEVVASRSALVEIAFQAWHSQMLRTSERRREDEEQRSMNAQRIEAWLCRRQIQLDNIKPKVELKKLVQKNLNSRGPLKLMKLSPAPPGGGGRRHGSGGSRPSSTQSHSQCSWHDASYYSLMQDSASPYLSPNPLWFRPPQSARGSRTLPPLGSLAVSGTSNKWLEALRSPSSSRSPPETESASSPPHYTGSRIVPINASRE
mmetsp:Transcript_62088/g.131153  ORF Transcript_62088/g.131153 Transcript_62088/m.131153 type:complete len:609 (-) Transcript_62088:61-1887(-)